MTSPQCWAIVVAGGSGSRFGGQAPKQYANLAGRRILDWSLAAMNDATAGRVVLVVPSDRIHHPEPLAALVVAGGSTRTESVKKGLAALPAEATQVLVHDAARPCVPAVVVQRLLHELERGARAAIPGLGVADTIKRVSGGSVVETLQRSELVAVQTPQAFSVDYLRTAHSLGLDATDDASLMEQAGFEVRVVEGSAVLRKITEADDVALLESLLHLRTWEGELLGSTVAPLVGDLGQEVVRK